MNARKILICMCIAVFLSIILSQCGRQLINLEPSLPNCIRIEPERCDWGNVKSVIWLVEGDEVEIQSVKYDRTRSDVSPLLIHFYDSQVVDVVEDTALIDAHTISLIGIQDHQNAVPWIVPVHPEREKDLAYNRDQNYKRHFLYGLIDPYDKVKELNESNNVARSPVNILWEPKVEFTSSAKTSVTLLEIDTIKVERPIIPIIFFDARSTGIRDRINAEGMLREISVRLIRNPAATLVLKGYVDNVTDGGVENLAQARAKAVEEALLAFNKEVNIMVASHDTYDDTSYFWRGSQRRLLSSSFQEENRRVEMEVKIAGAATLDGMEIGELTGDHMKQLVNLLTENEGIVLILEKPYPSGPQSSEFDRILAELQDKKILTTDMLGPRSLPEDSRLDSLQKKLEEIELTALGEIERERKTLLERGGMSTFSDRVYLRTYQSEPGPVRIQLSGDPIIYEPIKARFRFDKIEADPAKTAIKVISSAGTKDMRINILNRKGETVMSFGQVGTLFEYPDTLFTVSLNWIWDIGSQDSSKIEVTVDNKRNIVHRNFTWDWNKLDLETPDNSSLSLEVVFEDSACQVVSKTLNDLINIQFERVVEELHDVHIIVHCVFDQDNPLSSYLELRIQDLARILMQDIDVKRERFRNVDASGHTCIVGTQERNQRLSILRTIRTYRNFKNYIQTLKGFRSDEELLRWLGCDITQSPWSYHWPYDLRREGEGPTNEGAVIDSLNRTPEQRVANRRAEIEFFKVFR